MSKYIVNEIKDPAEFSSSVLNLVKENAKNYSLSKSFFAIRPKDGDLFFTGFSLSERSSIVNEFPKSKEIYSNIDFDTLIELSASVYKELGFDVDVDAIIHNAGGTEISVDFQSFDERKILIRGLNSEELAATKDTFEIAKRELKGKSY